MSRYRTLRDFRGIHAGRPAAILGAGPSLRHLQPEWLDGYVVFAINSAFVKYPDCDYFVTADSRRPNHWSWHQLQHRRCTVFMTTVGWWQPNLAEWAGVPPERVVPFVVADTKVMAPNAEKICLGNSSPHAAAHLAIIMGCEPIVLLGCDCHWEGDKLHFHAFDGQPQDPVVIPYHRSRPMSGQGKGIDANQQSDMRVWRELAEANPGVQILNASGGVLDVFPRIAMADLPKYA